RPPTSICAARKIFSVSAITFAGGLKPSTRRPVFAPSTTHAVLISAPSVVLQMSMGAQVECFARRKNFYAVEIFIAERLDARDVPAARGDKFLHDPGGI